MLSLEHQSARMSKKRRLNPVWHGMLYSCCTHMATVGVKGLTWTGKMSAVKVDWCQ